MPHNGQVSVVGCRPRRSLVRVCWGLLPVLVVGAGSQVGWGLRAACAEGAAAPQREAQPSEGEGASAGVPGPSWAADAIWYQVLVSRYRNGSTANDPPGTLPWTDAWAELGPGEVGPLRERLFGRRYGGDLQGLREKLPYLRSLGVNTLYLNPVFCAPSEHKYDTSDYRHIDDTYGVRDSRTQIGGETEDPLTWQWTESDRVFLGFLAEAHGQGLRVVVDGVFNHVGREFWAWRDVCARGRGSVYADWFAVREWTDDGGGVLAWDAWDGPNGSLVRFRRVGDGLHPGVEHHLFAVVRRWMDPDGDGDPSDGVDGWRLDAAEQVPHAFWRRFRRVVKSANPRALIVGEIWTDARAWLGGQEFDSVTNYPFSSPVVSYFRQGGDGYLPTDFADTLKALYQTHQPGVALGQMNLLGSHDTERAVSMLADPQLQRGADGRIPRRDLLRPDEDAYRRLKLALFTQSTYPGAPLIYYGDEVGMYGGDDPFCRGPMQWADLGSAVRTDLADVYAALARLRRGRPELRRGGYELLLADDARRLIAFRRSGASGSSVVLVNSGPTGRTIWLTLGLPLADVSWVTLRTEPDSAPAFRRQSPTRLDGRGRASFACPAIGATVVFVGGDESGLSGTKLVDSPAGPALE